MIHYDLRCTAGHEFDGWFPSSDSFAKQQAAHLVQCPSCGGTDVARALMAPSLGRKGNSRKPATAKAPAKVIEPDGSPGPAPRPPAPALVPAPAPAMPDELRAMLQKVRAAVERNCEHVGDSFAKEARAIHEGTAAPRGIYGEATPEQAESLAEDGIDITRIPWVPRADG